MAGGAYYMFYPLYLTEQVGIRKEWVGLVSAVGVLIEIPLVLAFGWLVKWMGLRRLIILGIGCSALRLVLLAGSDHIAIAIGTQVLHGLTVLAMHIAPPIFLNHQAGDRFRNSIQGLYVMAVIGPSKIIGLLLAGQLADRGLQVMFGFAALFSLASLVLFAIALHPKAAVPSVEDGDADESSAADQADATDASSSVELELTP